MFTKTMSVAKPSSNFLKVCPIWAKRLTNKKTTTYDARMIYSQSVFYDHCMVGEAYGFKFGYITQSCTAQKPHTCLDFSKKALAITEKYLKNPPLMKQRLISLGNTFAEHYVKVH